MSESDSFEQEATAGISEQVDALKGFLDEEGMAGGSPSEPQAGDDGDAEAPHDSPFASAVTAVASRWTAHGSDAPEHAPIAVPGPDGAVDPDLGSARSAPEGGGRRMIAPDGEEIDESGGSSDGYESGQDAGSMS